MRDACPRRCAGVTWPPRRVTRRHPPPRPPTRLQGAGLLQDGRLPARLDPQRHPAIRDLGAANSFTVDRHRGRRPRSPPPTWPSTRRWCSSPPPATCSTPPSRPPSSPTSAPAAATSACTRPPTPSTTGRSTAASSAPGSLAPGDPAGHRHGRGPGARGHRPPAADLDPHRRVVQLPHQPAGHRHGAADPRRVVLHRRRRWARPPDHLVPDLRRRPVLLHRPRPHRGVLRRAELPHAAARRHPVRGQAGQGRLPAGDRLHRRCTTARPPDWTQAGPGGFTNSRRHADLRRRHGHAVVPGQAVRAPTRSSSTG